MHLHLVSLKRYSHTMFWAILCSALIVAIAASLARATMNVAAALTDKPELAIYLLRPEEQITDTTLLRAISDDEQDYLATTKDGPKLIRIKRGPHQWYIEMEENLH